ncbi:DUF2000 family protein [Variovorax sp. HJSM1_2]|uniref:DUF2000 family protein n=1 Tax=Variovorax sp. HJSM1_2 TaxID=3366263 RepID=UPI003BC16F72
MFDTKVALIVRDDLATWQRLNVVAFLATGIAASAPDMIGQPYIDAAGQHYAAMLVQPMMILQSDLAKLQSVRVKAIERELTVVPYVFSMFSTSNDEANRQAFGAEDAGAPDLVGLALRGPKNAVDKAIKGLSLHP